MDPLTQLQSDLAQLLLGDPVLAAVPVSTFKEYVAAAIASEATDIWTARVPGKLGTAIQVRMPAIRSKYPNVPGPQLEVEQTIRIFEDPVQNTTGLTAESIGLEVLAWLHGTRIEDLTELAADTRNYALRPVYDYHDRFAYDAVFIGQLPQNSRARTDFPQFADDGACHVTLTCPDPAAAIYFSTDGTLPVIGDTTRLYVAPFAVAGGTVVRCYAWKTGQLPSYIQSAVIT
jgi:hypothetical protein